MLNFAVLHIQAYLLILLRVVAFVGASPVLSVRTWPTVAKLGFAGFIALLVTPAQHTVIPDLFVSPGEYIVMALQETAVGLLLGFVATLIFSALQVAGQIFDIQVGISSATLFDPNSGSNTGITGTFHTVLFTLYFLGMDGLDGLTLAILHSYDFIPIGKFHLHADFVSYMTQLFGVVMVLAIQVAAPLLAALLLTDVTFALISRAVPQMNIFAVGAPAKLFVGLSLFAAVMPGIVYLFNVLFATLFDQLNLLLRWLGGT